MVQVGVSGCGCEKESVGRVVAANWPIERLLRSQNQKTQGTAQAQDGKTKVRQCITDGGSDQGNEHQYLECFRLIFIYIHLHPQCHLSAAAPLSLRSG